jgi:hypothetical protein
MEESDSNNGPKRNDIEQPMTESSDPYVIERLLENFNADEFLVEPKFSQKIHLYLLKFRSNLPMITTILLIYGISLVYFLTFLLPLLVPTYNDKYKFIIEDTSRVLSFYSTSPTLFHWFLLFIFLLDLTLITMALYKATYTGPGSNSGGMNLFTNFAFLTITNFDNLGQEWDMKKDVLEDLIDKGLLEDEQSCKYCNLLNFHFR